MNKKILMKLKLIVLCSITITLSTGCSELIEVVPTEEEVTDKVTEEVTKTVTEQADKLAEDGKKTAEELLKEGQSILDGLLGESSGETSESIEIKGTTERIPVTLDHISDGDTAVFLLKSGAGVEKIKVRYLLIDTPESNHPQLGKQKFSKNAKERNAELLDSGEITLEFDVGERVDHYSRYLAYVYVDGVSVQETLVKEGLARVGYVNPPNTRYLDAYEKAQKKAKNAGIGIWSIENYVTDKGFNSN